MIPGFSFVYNDTLITSENLKGEETSRGMRYRAAEGLIVEICAERYEPFGAVYWTLRLENIGKEDTGLIRDLRDCDVLLPLKKEGVRKLGHRPGRDTARVVRMGGITDHMDAAAMEEFRCTEERLLMGQKRKYQSGTGTSCYGVMPFFTLVQGDEGYIVAIGWSGVWSAEFERVEEGVRLNSGIAHTAFVLHPGEEIYTSSMLLLPFTDGEQNACNRFRRLMKAHFSIIGQPGRPEHPPMCFEAWGGLPSEEMIGRIRRVKAHHVPYEYYWVDAGWYGHSDKPCSSCYDAGWGRQTGSWNVNPHTHPDGFHEVVKEAESAGMGFMLWLEPERVIEGTDMPAAHPEWFLRHPHSGDTLLLDLGNDQALEAAYQLLADKIENLNVRCYRQDFNTDPMPYWQHKDAPDRQGISEIRHVRNLYRLWDRLLERFPYLIIDNCAGGGRRMDIEMLKRSFVLWRTDYLCCFDADPEIVRLHTGGLSRYLPHVGSATKTKADTYTARSSYGSAWAASYWCTGFQDMSEEDLEWARKTTEEYLFLRPYFSCDYYELEKTTPNMVGASWTVWQYDRPEQNDGIIMAFRSENTACCTVRLKLGAIRPGTIYVFRDLDGGQGFKVNGEMLTHEGLEITLDAPRSCKVLHYTLEFLTPLQTAILENAKRITDLVREEGFLYGDAPINPPINHEAKMVSCDRFVDWVLYDIGFTQDQPYIQGHCVESDRLTGWCAAQGFEKITDPAKLQPGDVVFVNPNEQGHPRHTFIHAGRSRGQECYRYDCGSDKRIRSHQPSSEPVTPGFMFAYRAPKLPD